MVHGGGTVAGESPDKSEQRKSSGETASGEHDPRLALLGQSTSASPAIAPDADQPTAVFALPPEPRPAAPGRSRREPGTDTGSAAGDAQLRSAVAAWVASADDDADDDAGGEPGSGGGTGTRVDAGARAGGDTGGTSGVGTVPAPDTDHDSDSDSGSGPDSAPGSGSDRGSENGTGSGSSAGTDAGTGPRAGSGDSAAEVTAVLPESRETPETTAEVTAVIPEAAEDPQEAAEAASGSAGPASGPEDAVEAGTASGGPSGGASGASGETEPESETEPEASERPASGPKDGPKDGAKAGAGDGPGTGGEESPAPGGTAATAPAAPAEEASRDADPAAGADAADAGMAGTTGAEKPDGGTGTSVDTETKANAGSGSGSDTGAGSGPRAGASGPDAEADTDADANDPDGTPGALGTPRREVDQPTAVFKALREPSAAPAVDSPTTALKLPPAPRPVADPGPASDSAGRPSTFVPLRGDDAAPSEASRAGTPGTAATSGTAAPAGLTEAERTTQQPVPPLPPLDLLAELTNTPETPVRTVVRRIKIWTPLVLLLGVVFAVVQMLRPLPDPELTLSAAPAYTFEGGRLSLPFPAGGQGAVEVEGLGVIGAYGAQKPAPIASVAKTMTAYVILRDHPLKGKEEGEKITVDKQAADESDNWENESVANLVEGQEHTLKQMLQLMMIPSGNNAARLLARWDSPSEAAFVEKMNRAAEDLGMNDTVYTDPSGFKKTTISTPMDQLKLAKVMMKNDVFRGITDTTNADVPGSGKIRNGNDRTLLQPDVDGIKTGSSTPAGGNLLWSFQTEVDGRFHRVNGITMNIQDGTNPYEKTQKAITHSIDVISKVREGVTSATVVKKGDVLGHLDNGMGGRSAVVATKDLKAVGWAGLRIELALDDGGRSLPDSGRKGDAVGQVSIGTGPAKVSVPVALQQDLAEPGWGDRLTRIG
ncbi:serine hydrolase [Streptomyces sp. NPDC004609]|uniref:D-alanyl-D-alanine carboxypeptidase n=1 Tax=Streptomyces sp. NPDC004609 TaxID=3364704 RepID=UPI003693C1FF